MTSFTAISSRDDLWQQISKACQQNPSTPLIVDSASHASVSSRETVLKGGEQLAAYLQTLGIGTGDVIAVQLPSWLEWAYCAVAAIRLNATILPIWTAYGTKELSHILVDSDAKIFVSPSQWNGINFEQRFKNTLSTAHHINTDTIEKVLSEPAVTEVNEHLLTNQTTDIALLIYTSGTTSKPKGVCHSAASLIAEISQLDNNGGARLCPWPLGHIAGALEIYRFLLGWPLLVLMEQWHAEQAARLIAKHHIVSTSGTPYHLSTLLDASQTFGIDITSLSDYMVGAAPVPPTLIERCETLGIHTYRCYGSTEHPTVSSGSPNDPLDKRLNTDGRLLDGVEIRILDDNDNILPIGQTGEIVTRGPDRAIGYLQQHLNSEAFIDDWYRSGDIGSIDAEGYLKIVDRKKDIIIRGGSNISSREIEECLLRHPDILDAAAIAAPHPTLGEIVCAVIVVSPNASISIETLIAFFAAENMAKFKTPERLEFVSALPRNTAGKVLKNELRTLITG